MIRIAFTALLALVALSGGAQASQLDAMKAGKMQCYDPNPVTHHCSSLARYEFGTTIYNPAEIMLSPSPLLIMTTRSVVTFENDAVCGKLLKSAIDAAQISVDGAPLAAAEADQVKARVWAAIAPWDGKEICTAYVPNAAGDSFTAQYTLDGAPDTTTRQATVIVVGPGDGWSVGP